MSPNDDGPAPQSANPLTEGLSNYIPLSAMPTALHREPLVGSGWRGMPAERREPLLALYEQHFFPTAQSVELACSLQQAMRASLDRRNPLSRGEQKRINQLALMNAEYGSAALPSLANPASGGIIAAETGMGKTCSITRALEVIAPTQFVVHGHSEACGWSTLTQVFYLRVDFPHNGTRGGLIARILGGLDALLGTDYMEKSRRQRNLDVSLFFVMKVLAMHRVGLLVLDEMQVDNFELCSLRREFVLFFLSLLNLGIPVVLSGHPGAFTSLDHEAQVVRRFSDIGYFRLPRAATGEEPWWKQTLVPGLMRFNLCEAVQDAAEITNAAFGPSAGIPGIFMALFREAQRIALRRGGDTATLTLEDFRRAPGSPRTTELTKLARWAQGDSATGVGYSDLTRASPAAQGREGNLGQARIGTTNDAGSTGMQATNASVPSVIMKLRRKDALERKRRDDRTRLDHALLKSLPAEDLRVAEHRLDILAGLDEHQAELKLDDPAK